MLSSILPVAASVFGGGGAPSGGGFPLPSVGGAESGGSFSNGDFNAGNINIPPNNNGLVLIIGFALVAALIIKK